MYDVRMKNELEITATTFQLTHVMPTHKCTYDVGDKVVSSLGKGIITQLNKETGNCKVLMGG